MKKLLLILGTFISLPLFGMNTTEQLARQITTQSELINQGLERARGLQGEERTRAMRELLDQFYASDEIVTRLLNEQTRELNTERRRLEEEANSMGLLGDESRNARMLLYAGLIGIIAYSFYQGYKEYKAKKRPAQPKLNKPKVITPILASVK